MMVPGVDERDVDLHFRKSKSLARLKPGEPAADDHHPLPLRCAVHARLQRGNNRVTEPALPG